MGRIGPISPMRPTIHPALIFLFRFAAGDLLQQVIDDAVLLGFLGAEEEVAVGIFGDPVQRLAGVLGEDDVQNLAVTKNLVGLNLDVADLALHAAVGLV